LWTKFNETIFQRLEGKETLLPTWYDPKFFSIPSQTTANILANLGPRNYQILPSPVSPVWQGSCSLQA
jgi:hypothetical protein